MEVKPKFGANKSGKYKDKKTLPDGISTLTAAEREAADIDCDGDLDNEDVLIFLTAIRG